MISQEVIDQQLVRLSALRNRPASVDEAVHAFRESAKDADHASRMTGRLLKSSPYFPAPSEIYDAAVATFRGDDVWRVDRNCELCDGTGYEPVWVLETRHRTPGGGAYVSTDRLKSREQAAELRKLAAGKNQKVWEGVHPCPRCHSVTPAPTAAAVTLADSSGHTPKRHLDRVRQAELLELAGSERE